jgi:glutamyl/glutaminyl-tRNA synthetase
MRVMVRVGPVYVCMCDARERERESERARESARERARERERWCARSHLRGRQRDGGEERPVAELRREN